MVDHVRSTWRVSIRHACRALPVERSTYHYRSRRAGQAQPSERIKEIAASPVRYGYRRMHVLLRWATDLHDQLATGTKLRVLTIVDTFSRFSPQRGSFSPQY